MGKKSRKSVKADWGELIKQKQQQRAAEVMAVQPTVSAPPDEDDLEEVVCVAESEQHPSTDNRAVKNYRDAEDEVD